jgi:hypothetical protein
MAMVLGEDLFLLDYLTLTQPLFQEALPGMNKF